MHSCFEACLHLFVHTHLLCKLFLFLYSLHILTLTLILICTLMHTHVHTHPHTHTHTHTHTHAPFMYVTRAHTHTHTHTHILTQYGIIIDAGSSHTTLYGYRWRVPTKNNSTGVIDVKEMYQCTKSSKSRCCRMGFELCDLKFAFYTGQAKL